jgi:hypothetical protein
MESITSSIYQFRNMGGRRLQHSEIRLMWRYHGAFDSPYPLPNDEEEVMRLDEVHFMIRSVYRRNILAPISRKATKILDIGTGSGAKVVVNHAYGRCLGIGSSGRTP